MHPSPRSAAEPSRSGPSSCGFSLTLRFLWLLADAPADPVGGQGHDPRSLRPIAYVVPTVARSTSSPCSAIRCGLSISLT